MARSKTSFTDVGPIAAQFKQDYSLLEQVQINSLSKGVGSIAAGPNRIRGDVSNVMSNENRATNAKTSLSNLISENMFQSGNSTRVSSNVVSRVQGSVDNRRPLYNSLPEKNVDISLASVRTPDPFRKTPNESIRDKRRDLLGTSDYGYEGLMFPSDLREKAFSFVQLKFFRYSRPTSVEAGNATEENTYIYLPLPEDMVQDFSVEYNAQDIGGLRQVVDTQTAGTIKRGINEGKSFEQIMSSIDGDVALQEVISTAKNLAFRSLASTNIGGLVGQEVGMIPNPHPTVFLDGVRLRQFDWVWKLIPKSEEEAQRIDKIIRILKKKCLPRKNNSYLTYPSLIQPVIVGNTDYVDDYKRCLVSKININYNGEGTSAFYRNGRPVSILLTIGFHEAELYLEDEKTKNA